MISKAGSQPVVSAKNIFKSFKDVKALNGVDLEIQSSQYTAVLGPNGAGKTTLVEIIEGIQFPDNGEILLFGKHWKHNKEELHHLIGISLQETLFEDKLTVRETLRLFASFYKLPEKRVDEILEMVNLKEKHKSYVVHLSGGQRQKLALGIALINKPMLLILDEPTTGLDPTARREIWNILRGLKENQGTSMILTTHYMEEAESLCDQIVIMDKGKVLAKGTLDELVSASQTNEIIQFRIIGQKNIPDFSNFKNIKDMQYDEVTGQFTLQVANTSEFLPVLIKYLNEIACKVSELRCRYVTLDDLFIKMTGRKLTDNTSGI
jgi:ABC-2 type transport system ATP-binding protein